MIFRSLRLRKLHACLAALLVPLAGYAEPDADAILAAARVNPLGQTIRLDARLRTGTSSTPFQILVEDGAVRYAFPDLGQELILDLKENQSVLSERIGGKTAPVRPARFDDSIRGTGVTYEDLALRFLYWPQARVLGEETVKGRKAWRIEVQSLRDSSQYGAARLWIDKESGALMRIEGYNRAGRLIRRFEVIATQKIDDQWMLRQMRVETLNPETRKAINRTYLEVLGKAE